MTRFRTSLDVLLLTVLFAAMPAFASASGPDLGPLISGASSYVGGTFVATDYAYDDRGAQDPSTLPGGDDEYPAAQPNAADLIQVQIDLNAGDVHMLALLETLSDSATPLVGFGFDTDANPNTGAASLPGAAWTPALPLGVDILVVASSTGGVLYRYVAGVWSIAGPVPATIDAAANTVEATLPAAIESPGTGTWRAFVVSGITQDSWLAGGPIYDLAFLKGETVVDRQVVVADILQGIGSGESTLWQDHLQAEVLGGTLDPSLAAATIDFAKVAGSVTELATADTPGWHTYLYRSELDLGEGVLYNQPGILTFQTNIYKGRYQPYLIYRNETGPNSALVMFLHGATENHLLNTFWYEDSSGQTATFEFPGIVVFPLGRGESLGYTGFSQKDVLDVLGDALTRLPVDPERVTVSGFSMGGIGTYRLGALYPDRWNTAISHAGTSSADSVDETELLQNFSNLPFRAEVGAADPLVSPAIYQADRDAWVALDSDFRFYEVFDGTHQLQPHLINCELLAAVARPRVVDPPRVRYAVAPATFESDPVAGFEFVYDSAYWVSGIAVRSGASLGIVHAVSLARADRTPTRTQVDQTATADGNDYCGPNPNVTLETQPIGNSWREVSSVHAPGPVQPTSNAAEVELAAVSDVTFDLARMSLSVPDATQNLELRVEGDGQTQITLAANWTGPVDVTKDGQPFGQLVPVGNDLVLGDDIVGEHLYALPEPGLAISLLVGSGLLARVGRGSVAGA